MRIITSTLHKNQRLPVGEKRMKSYIQTMRSKIGHQKFICPAARIIVENHEKKILVIERVDNGNLGIPAGSIEEGETIEACIIREVKEETGLTIISLEVIGISSNPLEETITYSNGDQIQYFTIEFYSNDWEGTIKVMDQLEVKDAKFVDRSQICNLPKNEQSAFDSLIHFRKYQKILVR